MLFLDILKDFSIFSIIGDILKWIVFAIIAITITLLIGSQLKLFKRNNKTANILAKLYYAVLPIYFLFFAIKIAPVQGAHKQLISAIEKNKPSIINYTSEFFESTINDTIALRDSSIQDITNASIDHFLKTREKKHSGFKLLNSIIEKVERSFLVKLMEQVALKRMSKYTGIDKDSGKMLYNSSLRNLFEEGEIIEILNNQINRFFKGLYKANFLFFLIGLILLSIEIIIAKILRY